MHTVQVQTVSRLSPANALGIDLAASFRRLARVVAVVLGRGARTNRDAVPHYEGHAWCDSMEQQVTGDIVSCRRPRF